MTGLAGAQSGPEWGKSHAIAGAEWVPTGPNHPKYAHFTHPKGPGYLGWGNGCAWPRIWPVMGFFGSPYLPPDVLL